MRRFTGTGMALLLASATLSTSGAWAQDDAFGESTVIPGQGPGRAQQAEQAAPIDLTGYWVSVVTEDWRWRMLTPPKGDYSSVPLNPAGKKIADQFDPALYGGANYQDSEIIDCRAYGAAGLMRMPTRVHITWADPNQLKVETDWGQQTRQIFFEPSKVPTQPSFQGSSLGMWMYPPPVGNGFGFLPMRSRAKVGKLKVMTTDLMGGWLRRNGVPYSDHTVLTEYYQSFTDARDQHWFDVTTVVTDPVYLVAPFTTSSDFRREPDGAKWAPHACRQ